ncbi:alpha-1,2-fucosyltransferase [Butyrivibrio sp. INlla16]|uniref:alpha-1,2-fucosyltransferase n=1 Tax=Butyrivibrio sp. INlla16 TaxID=1520807 RepID=UPI0008879F2B|nr:alpha-1,2-fucosyltransferase [Butyrivibrio sp. INlla16]SDB47828.1 Glycosyl transferase family 11 [Butyrivibrio sp. INlla16]
MLIIQIAGGLGNQMQQYAMYRKLLKAGADRNIKLDIKWFDEDKQSGVLAKRKLELEYFTGLPLPVCSESERARFTDRSVARKVVEKLVPGMGSRFTESCMYHPEIFELKDKYIEGYFACQKYYDDIMGELQELFVFPTHSDEEINIKNMNLMNEMEMVPSVSVHIRRGDYLDPENAALFGNIATDAYYDSAMEYFKAIDPDTHFYIFTNDPEYARAKYADPGRYTIVDHNTGKYSLLDIQLMSHCRGNICANSTFSFWGARLNRRKDKIPVRTLVMRNNQPVTPELMHEYWPGWVLVDKDGKVR